MNNFIAAILFTSIFNTVDLPIIPAEVVSKHMGETVKVVDKVYSSNTDTKDIVLKVGGASDHQYLTVIIKLDGQEKAIYTGYNIYVTGKLVKYKGAPAIIVNNSKQIGIVMADHDLRKAFN
ncbi:hypothetical protein [Mucilaginibacter jinjuensis]|uniref:Nucleic acid binding protein n=1 Tax=Mucilaginibacter jinjuensis TaxID=1176721 RepID=A0ABY7T1G3_9SPHI|nr:hypothetical protein [Mucilaginibacter jinjuensis]WCT10149.1 hypothetical protein PQO05_15550 [Mucilaginibacter jinjuensis]